MAIRLQRVLIACGLPAIIAIVSFYWLRKRRKAITDSRSPLKQSVKTSDKSLDSIVVEKLENITNITQNQSETYCDSPQIDTEYRMQLRDNNNSNTASNATNACDSSSRTDFNSQITTPTTTRIENTFELKCHLNSQNNGDKYTSNEKNCFFKYNNASEDRMVNKSFDSEDCYEDSAQIEANIVNARDSICDKSIEQKDYVLIHKSCLTSELETNVVSHNDNDIKSIIDISDESNNSTQTSTQVLSSDENCEHESHPVMVSNSSIEVNNCSNDRFLMSQTNSIEATSSACSSSASCLMANGYDGDVYHNYPDSVTNSAIDHSPPHSAFSDNHSEGSSDSGKGGSDILHVNSSENTSLINTNEDPVILYQFEIPQYLCGRLIGSGGRFVLHIKKKTNTIVIINRHLFSSDMKICTLTGTKSDIKEALNIIRNRFPFNEYPNVSLTQINLINAAQTCSLPQTCQLQLPSGISCDVILSSMVNAGHFFLQQPTHPTYPSLSRLDQYMSATYSQLNAPNLPHIHSGMICAVPIMGGWFRAVVTKVYDSEECDVMFVDYGGFSRLPISSLRQIRFDFMSLPFQASECLLANVEPINSETGWTVEANALFEELAQGQILQAFIVGYSDSGVPLVHLYKVQGVSNVFINQELVNESHAQWVDTCV